MGVWLEDAGRGQAMGGQLVLLRWAVREETQHVGEEARGARTETKIERRLGGCKRDEGRLTLSQFPITSTLEFGTVSTRLTCSMQC